MSARRSAGGGGTMCDHRLVAMSPGVKASLGVKQKRLPARKDLGAVRR